MIADTFLSWAKLGGLVSYPILNISVQSSRGFQFKLTLTLPAEKRMTLSSFERLEILNSQLHVAFCTSSCCNYWNPGLQLMSFGSARPSPPLKSELWTTIVQKSSIAVSLLDNVLMSLSVDKRARDECLLFYSSCDRAKESDVATNLTSVITLMSCLRALT